MALQVCISVHKLATAVTRNIIIILVQPEDYEAVNSQIIQFNVGDERVTHTITINQDDACETVTANTAESFFSNLVLCSATAPIRVVQQSAEVTINDSMESECSEFTMCLYRFDYSFLYIYNSETQCVCRTNYCWL